MSRIDPAEVDARAADAIAANSADLLAYLERRVAAREDAADLLGETMLAAWRRARAIPADAEGARMWLFGVARNSLLNYSRGKRRRLDAADSLRSTLGTAPTVDPSDPGVLDVRTAIAKLPADLAEIVRLIHWDGFSQEDVAALLGIPASTVRGKYSRAREHLRVALETYAISRDG